MIYPATAILHIVMGFLSMGSAVYLLYRKEAFRIHAVKNYFFWFVFFTLYNFLLVLPLLIFSELSIAAGISYIVALLILAIAAWQGFLIALNLLNLNASFRRAFSTFYIGGAALAVLLHFIYFELPRGTADGNWVLWYSNQPIAFFYIFFMFVAGWAVAFSIGTSIFSFQQTSLRVRSIFLALGAFLLPFAALLYFAASEPFHIQFSLEIVGIALVFFLIGNVGVGILKKR